MRILLITPEFKAYIKTPKSDEDTDRIKNKMIRIMNYAIDMNGKENWDFSKIMEYCRILPITMMNVLHTTAALRNINETIGDGDISNLDHKSLEFKQEYNTSMMINVFSTISDSRRHLKDKNTKTITAIENKVSIYRRFIKEAEKAFENGEIVSYEYIIRDIDDEYIKRDFLRLVYKHNKVIYDAVDREYEELNNNSLTRYLTILKNNNIRKEEINLDKVMRNSCEDLDKMLKILNAIISDKKTILRIIEISDLENVNYFKELKSKGIVGNKILTKYPLIFEPNSEYRLALENSINIINSYNLDFSLFNKCPETLVENCHLKDNLDVLFIYGLFGSLANSRKIEFLMKKDLSVTLDKVIELGYEGLLNDRLDLLNEDNWDRIFVLKSMGLKPETREELVNYLRMGRFFIPDSQLGLYIDDATKYYDSFNIPYETDLERILSDYDNTNNSLNFDGVIISKNRVARNLFTNDFGVNEFFKAIITGSILDIDEIKTIKSCLKRKVYKID